MSGQDHDRRSYEYARLATRELKQEFEYVIAQIDLSSQSGSFWGWKEVQPNSSGPLAWTPVPGGRSGTNSNQPAILFQGFSLFSGVTVAVHVLLKTRFLQTPDDPNMQTVWIAVLPVGQG